MNKLVITLAVNLLFVGMAPSVLGQTSDVNDTVSYKNIGEILVTANRISSPLRSNPGSVSLVGLNSLSTMSKSISADEALRLVPGVRIDNQADGSRIHLSIRGQGILSERGLRGIKVLIDGMPVNDPTGFAPDLYDIDWSAVSRIEVLRGPAASLYGGGANAGILNISTFDEAQTGNSGSLSASAGSNGFFKFGVMAGGNDRKTAYGISYSNFGGSGYRDHTAYRGSVFNSRVSWMLGDRLKLTHILIATRYFNQNAEGLNLSQLDNPKQPNPDAIPCNEYQDTRRATNGLVADFRLSDHQSLNVTAYLRTTSYKEPGSSAVQYRQFLNPGGSFKYELNSGSGSLKNHFAAGLDWQFQQINEYKFPNIKDPSRTEKKGSISYYITEGDSSLANQIIKQTSTGLFLIDRLEMGPDLNTIFSIRYDNIKNRLTDLMNRAEQLSGSASFEKISARLGLAWNPGKAANLYGNIGQGFLPPSTEELINNPFSFGGFNRNIKPSTSLGEEIGIRGYPIHSLFYDITLFNLNTDNDFYRFRVPSRPLETFYGNAGSSRRKGVEVFVKWSPIKDIDLQCSYTYSHFIYSSPDSINGNFLPNSPAHQLYADAGYRIGRHLTAGVSFEVQSKWYIYTDAAHSSIEQEGFTLFHARISGDFILGGHRMTAALYGKNLLNTQYIAFTEPDPDGNSYQPSPRRELFLSIKINF